MKALGEQTNKQTNKQTNSITYVLSSLTNEGSVESCYRDLIHEVDPEDSVAQEDANFERYPCACVRWQVEADDVHYHEEDAGDE